MHDSGKQVVIASEKFPRDIPNLEERLRSRFQWGLMAEIKLPEIETRIAIIKKKTEEKNILIPDNIVHYIASHVESNIGETEGFLTLIIAYSSFTKREINIDLVKEVLKMVKQIDLT
jgi:chromosomal replication initiator protein